MYKTFIIATLTAGFSATASAADNATEKISATAQYDFILGDWDIEAATMQQDRSLLEGSGVMSVYAIHDGQTLQADLQVQFVNETGFIGSTMRTYDACNENWAVSWVPAGAQANAGGTAVWQDDRMVETWPSAKDQFGEYRTTLTLFDITENRFVVSMDHHYVDGPTIEGVWRYVATRRDEADIAQD
ncbi:hypothetical protein [Parvularcula marina]|uniref:hypothetical protein n=1 Tax=Parvularcula marina TaxID=2292771 RepID=UPI003515CFA0